jgi:hypothetical protein
MPQPKSRVLVSIVGQSNELGSGPSGTATASFGGAPLKDPVQPNAGTSTACSWWPRLAERLGRERNVWLDVVNTAVGATSLRHSWCGTVVTWTSSMLAVLGTYCLSGGGIWRCNLAAGTVGTCTVAPTGTSNTTGADSVPWVYLGVPTGADVAGTIYASGSPRFDPNGYLAAARAPLLSRPGYDRRIVVLSIGQGDRTMTTSTADFATSYGRVVDYITASAGLEIMLGFTCVARTAGSEAYYAGTLNPGYLQAATDRVDNVRVWRGANLYERFGNSCMLQVDNVHMDAAMYEQAADAWFSAFVAAGIA